MRSDVYVYISGPMTAKNGFSIEANLAEGVDLFLSLLKQGIPAHCPHLNGYPPSCWTALPHESWVALDKVVLDRCTHVLMMPRWRLSSGARIEHDYATEIGLPIAYNVAELTQMLTRTGAVAGVHDSVLAELPAVAQPGSPAASSPPTSAPRVATDASAPPPGPETPAT